ncbi:MAG TPA: SGNH/GDSL hydrolase family protein [Nodosilinea sp.]|nr:SGNH/GDSL hydrolase family protein [Nodosilinea sp.]
MPEITLSIPPLGQLPAGQLLRALLPDCPPIAEPPTTLVPTLSGLTVFGDSLSDPGNLFGLTGFFPPFPYDQGRFSNGDLWVDYLADRLALPEPVQNFAVGGALTGRDNGLDPLLSLLTDTETNLPGLLDQVDSFVNQLGESAADPDQLYVVWAGANDLLNLPSDPAAIPDFLAASVQNVATAIGSLAQRGADRFLVPNLPNLGLLPRALADGTGAAATALSGVFNTGLALALEALEQDPRTDIDIVSVDLFELTTTVLGAPAEFGFTNVTDPLLGTGGLTDPGFFWWDAQHPTTQAHGLLAEVFATELLEAGYLAPAPVTVPGPPCCGAGEKTLLTQLAAQLAPWGLGLDDRWLCVQDSLTVAVEWS